MYKKENMTRKEVLDKVNNEREKQIRKWGTRHGELTIYEWLAILGEEVGEANQAALKSDPRNKVDGTMTHEDFKKELIQIMAVCSAILEEYY